jgi:hypothetical protein
MAQAGAGVAGAAEPGAIWTNPAGLALSTAQASAALAVRSRRQTFLPQVGPGELPVEARSNAGPLLFPVVAYAHPLLGGTLWLAAGYRLAQNESSDYPAPENGSNVTRYLGESYRVTHHQLSLAAGLRLGKHLSLGAAVEVGYLNLSYRRTLWLGTSSTPFDGNDASLDLPLRTSLNGTLIVGRIGLQWFPTSWITLGLTFELPSKALLSGKAILSQPGVVPPGYDQLTLKNGDAALHWDTPLRAAVGLQLRPLPWITLALDGQVIHGSAASNPRMDLTDVSLALSAASTSTTIPITSLPLEFHLRTSGSIHCAASLHLLEDFLQLTAGWAFDFGLSDPSHPSPLQIEPPRHRIAGGFTVRTKRARISLAVAHHFSAELDASGAPHRVQTPLDPSATGLVGNGRYQSATTEAIFEIQASW